MDYDYDGVIWDLSYEDHEKRFLAEIGSAATAHGRGGRFVEIGCGMGLTSFFASKNMQCDALGVDLSLAVLQASQHFKTDPFLHFVQGSAFYLPIRRSLASVMYSHGVLHHTYSTAKAVASVAQHVQEDGWLYLWLYGSGSKKGSPARRIAYMLEEALRPMIARNLASVPSRAILAAMAYGYRLVNAFHRSRDSSVEKYDYARALHAARDRFTPIYAHRQDFAEVASWLRALGFENVEEVDWQTMPTANQDNYRRNTGVRGKRAEIAHRTPLELHLRGRERIVVRSRSIRLRARRRDVRSQDRWSLVPLEAGHPKRFRRGSRIRHLRCTRHSPKPSLFGRTASDHEPPITDMPRSTIVS